jgi:RNA:NAD 2'-phosphotransferase (TPT1/KptA family)
LYFDVVNDSETISASQFLNPILRRELGRVGLLRGEAGWIGVDDL